MQQKTKTLILLALISLLTIISGCIEEKAEIPIKLGLTVLPLEEKNLTQVILTVQSEDDVQNVTGQINIPEGVEVIAGNTEWQTNLQANQPQTINITIKTASEETLNITANSGEKVAATKFTPPLKGINPPSGITYLYQTEDEYKAQEEEKRKNPESSIYEVCDGGCWVPKPLKGEALNDYFKSLKLQEDSVYVTISFEPLDLQAPQGHLAEHFAEQRTERDQILKDNGAILVGRGYGDLNGWHEAKVPKKFLEEQHYDFIRWIGIKTPERKLYKDIKEKIWGKNCTGRIKLEITLYEKLTDEQFETMKKIANGKLFGYSEDYDPTTSNWIDLEIDVDKLKDVVSLNFVSKIAATNYVPSAIPEAHLSEEEVNRFKNVTCNGEQVYE